MAFADEMAAALDDIHEGLADEANPVTITHKQGQGEMNLATGLRDPDTQTHETTAVVGPALIENAGMKVRATKYEIRTAGMAFNVREGDTITIGGVVRKIGNVEWAVPGANGTYQRADLYVREGAGAQ